MSKLNRRYSLKALGMGSLVLSARACLMTGLYPHQAGVGHMMGGRGADGYRGDLSTLTRDNKYITPLNDTEYKPKDTWFYTDAISDNAAKYIREHKGDNPFFVYVSYTAAHWPMHAPEKDIAKYKGKPRADKPIAREAIYWEHERNCAIRKGKWKLVGKGILGAEGLNVLPFRGAKKKPAKKK